VARDFNSHFCCPQLGSSIIKMVTATTNTQRGESECAELLREREEPAIPCFFCGVCCTEKRVKVSMSEARHICEGLGLNWYIFLSNYIEPSESGPDSFYLRQRDGTCIFLMKRGGKYPQYMCLIHIWKPAVCREWNASLYRKECREGLLKYWNLTLTPEGQLQGSEENSLSFQRFLKSLGASTVPAYSRCENSTKDYF